MRQGIYWGKFRKNMIPMKYPLKQLLYYFRFVFCPHKKSNVLKPAVFYSLFIDETRFNFFPQCKAVENEGEINPAAN